MSSALLSLGMKDAAKRALPDVESKGPTRSGGQRTMPCSSSSMNSSPQPSRMEQSTRSCVKPQSFTRCRTISQVASEAMPTSGVASSLATHDWRKREGGMSMPNSLITNGNAGEAAGWTPFQNGWLASNGNGLDGFIIDAI
eukprot:7379182-Prymnesium_polylepis.1